VSWSWKLLNADEADWRPHLLLELLITVFTMPRHFELHRKTASLEAHHQSAAFALDRE
jgi:hypothetical protein